MPLRGGLLDPDLDALLAGGGRGDGGDKARDEFLSEAQELVDGLGRDLLHLDEGLKRGRLDAELINDVFRAVHTLKGLSGLFGAAMMSGLSHELEEVLEGSDRVFVLREGRNVAEFSHAEASEGAVMTAMAHGDSDLIPEGSPS